MTNFGSSMKRQKIKDFLPPGLLLIALIYTGISALTTDVVLSYKHWIAFGLVLIALAIHFVNRRISNVVLGLTIALGLFNIVSFTPMIVSVGDGLQLAATDVMVQFQLFPLVVFLVFIYFHWRALIAWMNRDGL